MNILMFNMSSWRDFENGVSNRNRHLLENLAERDDIEEILAIDFLPFNFKTQVKIWWRNILWAKKQSNLIYGDDNSICFRAKSKVVVYATASRDPQKWQEELVKIIKILGWNDFNIYSCNPLLGAMPEFRAQFREIKPKFIFDAIDDWTKHGSYSAQTKLLERQYQEIDQNADLILTVAEKLKNKFSTNKNVHWLPNGVDVDFFAPNLAVGTKSIEERLEMLRISPQYFDLKKIQHIVGYLGVVEGRLDVDLLEEVIKNNANKLFVFMGPTWPIFLRTFRPQSTIVKRLAKFPNVYFNHRYVPYSELPKVYSCFDVGIIPNKINEFTASMNPHKLYEYLAAGKPVVSTATAGVDSFKDVVYISCALRSPANGGTKNGDEFDALLNKALNEDSSVLRQKRIDAVRPFSWNNRVEELVRLMK